MYSCLSFKTMFERINNYICVELYIQTRKYTKKHYGCAFICAITFSFSNARLSIPAALSWYLSVRPTRRVCVLPKKLQSTYNRIGKYYTSIKKFIYIYMCISRTCTCCFNIFRVHHCAISDNTMWKTTYGAIALRFPQIMSRTNKHSV